MMTNGDTVVKLVQTISHLINQVMKLQDEQRELRERFELSPGERIRVMQLRNLLFN